MASVELRPGDILNIVWTSEQETPFGVKLVESSFAFSYDEVLTKLRTKGRAGKSRKSGNDGARFSRLIALSTNALKKGKWSTGADIDRDEVFSKLIKKFSQLDAKEYVNITSNAKEALEQMYKNGKFLKPEQKKELKEILNLIGVQV